MKITIEPSNPNEEGAHNFTTVTVDTRCNDDLTTQAVAAVLDAVRAAGHYNNNIADAAERWAAENRTP